MAARLLPLGVGLVAGLALLLPWLLLPGPLGVLIGVSIATVAILTHFALVIDQGLPERPSLAPVDLVLGELRALAERYRELGFEPVAGPCELNVRPPAVVLGFAHEIAGSYGTVFATAGDRPRVAFDFYSLLEPDRARLTTSSDAAGAVLPAAPGDLRQVLPGADPREAFAAHVAGLAWLRGQGLTPRPVSAAAFETDLVRALGWQREEFLACPLGNAAVAVWRAATGRTPHAGPLVTQAGVARQLERLTAARGS